MSRWPAHVTARHHAGHLHAAAAAIIPTECSCERLIGLFGELELLAGGRQLYAPPRRCHPLRLGRKAPRRLHRLGRKITLGKSVVGTKWPFVKVIEGNRDDAVAYRVIPLGEIHIRGYGLPDYAAMTENTP